MINEEILEELEKISRLNPEECKSELIRYIDEGRILLKKIEERKGWIISKVASKKNKPYIYFTLTKQPYSRAKKRTKTTFYVALGKMLIEDYEKNQALITKYQKEKNVESLQNLLIPVKEKKSSSKK